MPAYPRQGTAEQLVSALFMAWTLVKCASVNVIGSEMRQKLNQSHAQLSQALSEVERLASMDELTTLPNRRAILKELANMRERMAPGGLLLGLAMLDIDHFKQINDRHGHPTGDAVLRDTGTTLRRGLRDGDLVGRFGGEEFVLLVPGPTHPDELLRVGERTRSAIEAHDWSHIHIGLRVTVSVGMTLGWPDEPLDEWLARADRALYQAKMLGRNQVAMEARSDKPGLHDVALAGAAKAPATAGAVDRCRAPMP